MLYFMIVYSLLCCPQVASVIAGLSSVALYGVILGTF